LETNFFLLLLFSRYSKTSLCSMVSFNKPCLCPSCNPTHGRNPSHEQVNIVTTQSSPRTHVPHFTLPDQLTDRNL